MFLDASQNIETQKCRRCCAWKFRQRVSPQLFYCGASHILLTNTFTLICEWNLPETQTGGLVEDPISTWAVNVSLGVMFISLYIGYIYVQHKEVVAWMRPCFSFFVFFISKSFLIWSEMFFHMWHLWHNEPSFILCINLLGVHRRQIAVLKKSSRKFTFCSDGIDWVCTCQPRKPDVYHPIKSLLQ